MFFTRSDSKIKKNKGRAKTVEEKFTKDFVYGSNLGVVSTALYSFSDQQKFEIMVEQLVHDHFVIIRIITFSQNSNFFHTYLQFGV
jgi:hypothetical protein